MVHCYPVLLAGGLGARLWPLSREIYPKQLLTVLGDQSLLQQTALRALELAPPEQIITVTTLAHYRPIRDQLCELDPALTRNILVEPEGRNTTAAIGVAALYVRKLHPNSTLLVMPADHAIHTIQPLLATFEKALELAETGRVVTLGIRPTRPETGFGYVAVGEQIADTCGAFNAHSFVEKPDLKTAKKLVTNGDVYWNSGIFIVTVNTLINEMKKYAIDALNHIELASANCIYKDDFTTFSELEYSRIPSLPIDKIIMEHTENLALFPIDVGWSDVGSWQRIWDISQKDGNGVATAGDVISENCRNSLLQSEHRLLVGAGLQDIAVVETADAVLVTKMGNDDDLRAAFQQLQKLERQEATRHLKENRPWGAFQTLMDSPGFKIKELIIKPGGQLSLQRHKHRTEHWIVVEGTARITRGDRVEFIQTNQSTYIAANEIHRLENCTETILRVIEIQCGDLLSEDDIERYDDLYGREPNQNSSKLS
jgi:mannose-1-phosphate guanylyltransferase/mannose-6-phosphate isomerase